MNKREEVLNVPISYEYLMSHLFGKFHYHGHVGGLTTQQWKKDLKKINKYVKKSILLNVNSDSYHKSKLDDLCQRLDQEIDKKQSIDSISISFIETYVKLIFNLLGDFPDHWRRRSPYADKFWQLDGHRGLNYAQSDEQKAALIINLVDIKKAIDVDVKDFENMQEAFLSFKSDATRFITWIKKEHPKLYCEIF